MRFEQLDAPITREPRVEWGSDAIAVALRDLDLPYIALTPGSSYRGLHDSIVNLLGNERPSMLIALHEEHAVAVAHGYAKVTERPMAVALHSNVGLMHATMAVFNAYCDRVPMVIVGANGPLDAAQRRPWIDWLHTTADHGALVRSYVKWDDQPASVEAAVEALARAWQITVRYPSAPTYVCLDVSSQERPYDSRPTPPRVAEPTVPHPAPASLDAVVSAIDAAEHPVLLVGRVGRSEEAWDRRVQLAESLQAPVVTDLKVAAAFPTSHALHVGPPGTFLCEPSIETIRAADLIMALDWVDLGGTLKQVFGDLPPAAKVVSCSMDAVLHNGWSKDHFALATVDVEIPSHPDVLVDALLARGVGHAGRRRAPASVGHAERDPSARRSGSGGLPEGAISMRGLAEALATALGTRATCLARLPLGWDGEDLVVSHPLDYLGQDGGAGIGSGPGMVVGAALALAGSGRLAVGVLGDGDYLMGVNALWTAAKYRLGMLVVVANNRSYMNDVVHQERVARRRGRPVENRRVGQAIDDPAPDLCALAVAQGLTGFGPVTDADALGTVLAEAVRRCEEGEAVVVDVRMAETPPAS